jgi:hypothetical protein
MLLYLNAIFQWIERTGARNAIESSVARRADGCDVFANARFCPALADRPAALRPRLER